MKRFLVLCASLVLLTPAVLFAATAPATPMRTGSVVRSGERVFIEATKEIIGNFYAFGGEVQVDAPVHGDAYIGGGMATLAHVDEDAAALGVTVRIADVAGDVRVAGGDILISGTIGGDVVAIGQTIHIAPDAKIGGDLIVYGQQVSIDGAVAGSVYGSAEELAVRNIVDGAVDLSNVGTLTLGPNAHVKGTLSYRGPRDLIAEKGTTSETDRVGGGITHASTTQSAVAPYRSFMLAFLAAALAGVAALLSFRTRIPALIENSRAHALHYVVLGAGVALAMPLGALILIATSVGGLLGGAAFAVYVALILLATIYAVPLYGSLILLIFRRSDTSWRAVLCGALMYALLTSFAPWVGLFLLLLPLGTLAETIYVQSGMTVRMKMRWKLKK